MSPLSLHAVGNRNSLIGTVHPLSPKVATAKNLTIPTEPSPNVDYGLYNRSKIRHIELMYITTLSGLSHGLDDMHRL